MSRISEGDVAFIQAVYLSSEADARARQKIEPATDDEPQAWERIGSAVQPERFVDLTEPWLYSR